MSIIFPIILVVISFSVMFYFVYRKFPQLTLLDVNAIPELKENKKKNEFLRKRIEKRTIENTKKWTERSQPLVRKFKQIQLAFRKYVGQVERTLLDEIRKEKLSRQSTEAKAAEKRSLHALLQDAYFSFEHEDYEAAEKKYISIISADSRNQEAYYGLGLVYLKKKQYSEAEETFNFLSQLEHNDSRSLFKLAELAEERGRAEEAIEYYQRCLLLEDSKAIIFAKIYSLLKELNQLDSASEAIKQAVELEPQNPKYLDNFLEISIMLGHKKLAEEIFRELRMVNPENQKLVLFRERIEKI